MAAHLHGFGSYVPERIVTNAELAGRLNCEAGWIEDVSGIRERRWAAEGETVADMGVAAAQDCLSRCGADPSSIKLLISASGSAAPGFPGPAAELSERLGLGTTPVLDLPVASAGSLFGMALASRLAESMGDVLVVAAEKMSAVIESHPLDQNTAILFGDGAGAALIRPRPGLLQIVGSAIHSDGQFRKDLAFDWKSPLKMNGLGVILQASRKMPAAIREVLDQAGIAAGNVAAFLVHQANQNLLNRVAKALAVPSERVFSNIARYGNTSSASLLIAAAEWSATEGATGPVVFVAFGAGYHWGALAAR